MPEPKNYEKKVFACQNNVYILQGRNLPRTEPDDGKHGRWARGICAGLTARWIQRSFQFGDLDAADQVINNLHQTSIAQAVFLRAWRTTATVTVEALKAHLRSLFDVFGMSLVVHEAGAMGAVFADFLTGVTKNILASTATPGAFCFVGTHGHALGFKLDFTGKNYIFEPESGLFQYKNHIDMLTALVYYLEGACELAPEKWVELAQATPS